MKIILYLAGVLTTFFLVVVAFEVYQELTAEPTLTNHGLGSLYLSLAKEGEDYDVVSMYRYVLGGENESITPIFAVDRIPTQQTEVINEAGDMFFVMTTEYPQLLADQTEDTLNDPDLGLLKGASNIILTNQFKGGLTRVLPDDNTLLGERHLDWNDNSGLLAFSAKDMMDFGSLDSVATDEILAPEEESTEASELSEASEVDAVLSNVYIVNPTDREVTKVAVGHSPHWLPDGNSLVFLGADGVYQYVVATKELRLVLGEYVGENGTEPIRIANNMNMDVSNDGLHMVVSSPGEHDLLFFDLVHGSELSIRLSETTPHLLSSDKQYYWPIFSPDGTKVAVQVTDKTEDFVEINPRIEIINLSDQSVAETISLAGYDFTRAFTDDWSY